MVRLNPNREFFTWREDKGVAFNVNPELITRRSADDQTMTALKWSVEVERAVVQKVRYIDSESLRSFGAGR